MIDAVEALATMQVPPDQYLRDLPAYMHYHLDDHLSAAAQWLTELSEQWRSHEKAA